MILPSRKIVTSYIHVGVIADGTAETIEGAVQSLFLFSDSSAVRMAGLHAIQEILNDPIIKLKRLKRKMSNGYRMHDAAIGSILRTPPSIIVRLEREGTDRSEPTAVGLAKNIFILVVCCHFLHQILPHISHLLL